MYDHSTVVCLSKKYYLIPPPIHPLGHALPHALLEGYAESGVAAVAALQGQLLSGEITTVGDSLVVEADEMQDTQAVDVVVVGGVLTRKV